MIFEFTSAGRIIFGDGVLAQVGPLAASLGRRALVTAGCGSQRCDDLQARLQAAGVQSAIYEVQGEPTLDTLEAALAVARQQACELVIGFGGGSALDMAKAVAALATNTGPVLDYLEVVGRGLPLAQDPLPVLAIPTTAGTGSEVTRNAVISLPEQGVKVSLRSPKMLPRIALVDPELTYSLPPEVTAATGMDALTQLIEPLVCNSPNPLVTALCREGIPRAAQALPQAVAQPDDAEARRGMALASLMGGLALANARLGAVHGFAGVLGGMYAAPHGVLCARLLGTVTEANINALRLRGADGSATEASGAENPALERYQELARLLTGGVSSVPEAASQFLHALARQLAIPRLAGFGLKVDDFQTIIEKAQQASSMRGNPIQLTPGEMATILQQVL